MHGLKLTQGGRCRASASTSAWGCCVGARTARECYIGEIDGHRIIHDASRAYNTRSLAEGEALGVEVHPSEPAIHSNDLVEPIAEAFKRD
jgi:hypothetical protein